MLLFATASRGSRMNVSFVYLLTQSKNFTTHGRIKLFLHLYLKDDAHKEHFKKTPPQKRRFKNQELSLRKI